MDVNNILNKLSRNEALTGEEQEYLFKALKSASSGKLPTGEKNNFVTYDDLASRLFSGLQEAHNNPAARAFADTIIRQKTADAFVKRYSPLFNAIATGADIATAVSQIRQSNKELAKIARPSAPSSPGLDPLLQAGIRSINPDLSAQKAIMPAEAQIREQRQLQENAARSVSGGQAAGYSARVNAAEQQSRRAAGALVPLQDQVRAREQARLDALAGMRSNVAQQNFQNAAGIYRDNLSQYNFDVNAAGALGQAGRSNLRQSMQQFPDVALRAYSQFMPVANPYRSNPTVPPQSNTFNPPSAADNYSSFEESVNRSLAGHVGRFRNQQFNYSLSDPYFNRSAPQNPRLAQYNVPVGGYNNPYLRNLYLNEQRRSQPFY